MIHPPALIEVNNHTGGRLSLEHGQELAWSLAWSLVHCSPWSLVFHLVPCSFSAVGINEIGTYYHAALH